MSPHEKLSNAFDKALNAGIESLSADEKDLYFIQDFIIELEMGGLSGYLYNRLAITNHVSSTISAMRTYGLSEMAELLAEANQLFPPQAKADFANTWAEVVRRHDPGNRLALIEGMIENIEDYGIPSSRIK